MERLADRLRERAARCFVGRQAELALIEASLAQEAPAASVFVVHGPGGIGKTSLVEQVRRVAQARGIGSLRLDARDVEPTPSGLLRALGAALELDPPDCTLGRVVERWSRQPRRLLVIDTMERLAHLEGWLRGTLLPELPESTRVILAGRGCDPAWRTDPLWREGARTLELRQLSPEHCARHLGARGVADEHHAALAELSRGHPLALTLLADTVLATGAVPRALGVDLVRQLAAGFTAHAETDLHRRALEVCAHARVTTEALLADAVDAAQARALFDWLAGLGFIEATSCGLFPHDLVRDAVDEDLRARHPQRYRDIHIAVRRHLIARTRTSTREAAAVTFDIQFLHRNAAAMRPFVDYAALGSLQFEPASAADGPALRALAAGELPPVEQAALERWLGHPAVAAWAIRPAPGELAGATLCVDLAALGDEERAADAVFASSWRALVRAGSVRPGDRQVLARWNLVAGGTRNALAPMNALEMCHFFQWLTDVRLGSFVICVDQPAYWAPMMRHIGFEPLAGCEFRIDAMPYGCYAHDWRREPLEQWLELMADRELGAEPMPAARPPARLDRPQFEGALREALRSWTQAEALAANPLAGCAIVTRAAAAGEPPGPVLQRVLLEAAQSLRERPRDQKFWRALELTYFRPAGSQELAAERLGLPFGTYRYQLATGVERLADALWAREQH